MLDSLTAGFGMVLQFPTVFYMVAGVVFGLVVGALPGLSATMGMIVLLPLTFGLTAIDAIQLLMGVFVGGITGGSVTAIAINIPGTAASAPTVLDGYPLTLQGRAGEAISVMYITSMMGGIIGALACISIAPMIAIVALRFGPPEIFGLGTIGLCMVISLSSRSVLKGLTAGVLGMILSLVGVDPIWAYPRFTFGNVQLEGGLGYAPVMIGLFGLTEVLFALERFMRHGQAAFPLREVSGLGAPLRAALRDINSLWPTFFRSSTVGIAIGAIPGLGADIAAWMAYDLEKKFAKHPEEFGKGSLQGMTACEVANNSEAGGALIPALTFGVPGDSQTAILIAALMLQGLRPGPLLFAEHGDIVWATFAGLIVAQLVTLLLGLLSVHVILQLITRPFFVLYPPIVVLCVVGTFAMQNSYFDVWVMMLAGAAGYFMKKYDYPVVPVALAFLLTPMIESELRRGLILHHGNFLLFFGRPAFDLIAVLSIFALATSAWLLRRVPLERSEE
jgi:putative tricarboxylic transport membrane protein